MNTGELVDRLTQRYRDAVKARRSNVIMTTEELGLIISLIAQLQAQSLSSRKEEVIRVKLDAGGFKE